MFINRITTKKRPKCHKVTDYAKSVLSDSNIICDSKLNKIDAEEMFKYKYDKHKGKELEKKNVIIDKKVTDVVQDINLV